MTSSEPRPGEHVVHATLIRAPCMGARVAPLASLTDGTIVAVEQGSLLGTRFHPEADGETRFHEHFIKKDRIF